MKYFIVFCLFLSACDIDWPVSRVKSAEAARIEQKIESCEKIGFCYTCEMGFTDKYGDFNCGYKWSAHCDGERTVEVRIVPVEITYESGKKSHYEETQKIRNLTSCE